LRGGRKEEEEARRGNHVRERKRMVLVMVVKLVEKWSS